MDDGLEVLGATGDGGGPLLMIGDDGRAGLADGDPDLVWAIAWPLRVATPVLP
jgi:hypothetical protein